MGILSTGGLKLAPEMPFFLHRHNMCVGEGRMSSLKKKTYAKLQWYAASKYGREKALMKMSHLTGYSKIQPYKRKISW